MLAPLAVCTCFPGYAETVDNQCHRVKRCEFHTLNSKMHRGGCEKENQFCRYSFCVCKPGFAYEQVSDECMPLTYEDSNLKKNNAIIYEKELIGIKESMKKITQRLAEVHWITLFLMGALAVTLLLSTLFYRQYEKTYDNLKRIQRRNLNNYRQL